MSAPIAGKPASKLKGVHSVPPPEMGELGANFRSFAPSRPPPPALDQLGDVSSGSVGPVPASAEGTFRYADLYEPARLADLARAFDRWFAAASPEHFAQFDAYRACKGEGMPAPKQSEALLVAAPFVGRFIGKLFRIEAELEAFRDSVRKDDPLWRFRKEFAKKRVLKPDAGKTWTHGADAAVAVAKAALQATTPVPIGATTDEELTLAVATLALLEIDEVARKAAKAGGAQWTDALRERGRAVHAAVLALGLQGVAVDASPDDAALGKVTA
ncbi:MAG: hypothetical protein ACRENE_10365, partial [Polyangiaceae bacterium]